MAKKKTGPVKKQVAAPPDSGRRKMLLLGIPALAAAGTAIAGYRLGWFSESPPPILVEKGGLRLLRPIDLLANEENAIAAANEMLDHYARELDTPSALIHAIRGLGRSFRRAPGLRAREFLLDTFAKEKEVNGKRYVYFERSAEVHDNSFLKTFLEAGLPLSEPASVGPNKYTLQDVADSAKALFRCDPRNLGRYDATLIHEHLPWTLIAFSILMPPDKAVWTNAYNETINLSQVIDRSLTEYEGTCALTEQAVMRGEPETPAFREAIKKYSCFGLHSVYGYLSCLKHSYRENNLEGRMVRVLDLVSYRLKGDAAALNGEYTEEGKAAPAIVVQALLLRAMIKLFGHAFESVNYVKLHKLFPFSPGQERRFQAGEDALYDAIVRIRALDWDELRKRVDQMLGPGRGDVFIGDIVIGLGHAARAMKLLTPNNPDDR